MARYNSVIAAAYSKSGTLISVQRVKIGDGEEKVKFEFEKNVEIDRFRILVWNSLTYMKPITEGEDVSNTP